MLLWQVVFLALLQGLTEFLPISSSAHLILLPSLSGWDDQGLAFDVAVHVGTLAAVVAYFRQEIRRMAVDWFRHITGGPSSTESRLAWAVLLGTIPVGLAGLLFKDVIGTHLRSPLVIAYATIGFGLLLWWADAKASQRRDEHTLGWRDVLFIGIAQAIALIPGTSRSGITITAGLMLGLTRTGAARFSFLLSIPVIVLAGGMSTLDLVEQGNDAAWMAVIVGALVSMISAYICIHWFLKLLDRVGMMPFVVYRLVLGLFLLYLYI